MLTSRYKAAFNRLLDPPARALAAAGVSPSMLTLAGVALSAAVCLMFVRTRAVGPFCIAILLTGGFDALDGAVARAGKRVTAFGAYLDAMCDRYVDAMVALSVAWVTGYWALTMGMLIGSLLISYAKARAAMEVSVSNTEWPDLMERAERDLLFLAGLAAGLLPWRPLGRDLFWWTLVVLNVLVHATVLQRMLRARAFIRERQ